MNDVLPSPAAQQPGQVQRRPAADEHRDRSWPGGSPQPASARVAVVDDDGQMRDALGLLLRAAGFAVDTYTSAEDYLERRPAAAATPDCLLLDMRMTGMDGLSLQKILVADETATPVIFITGHASVPTVVRAVKLGAFDVLEKPFNRETLLEKLAAALERGRDRRGKQSRGTAMMALTVLLSAREHEVFELLLDAKTTKEIAAELGISQKTVAKHRGRVLSKLRVDSVLELVRAISAVNEPGQTWPQEPSLPPKPAP